MFAKSRGQVVAEIIADSRESDEKVMHGYMCRCRILMSVDNEGNSVMTFTSCVRQSCSTECRYEQCDIPEGGVLVFLQQGISGNGAAESIPFQHDTGGISMHDDRRCICKA